MADTNSTGVTETQATKEDVVAKLVQAELIENGNLFSSIMDYSKWYKPGASQVSVPRAGSFAAEGKVENTDLSDQKLTLAADAIALGREVVTAQIEDDARDVSALELDGLYAERMASALVAEIEAQIATALVKSANDIQLGGASNLVITKANIINARRKLNEAKCPKKDRFLAISPAQEEAILNIAGFVSADHYGAAASEAVLSGEIGRIYGFRVLVTNDFASDSEAVAYHKSHVGFAMSQEFKWEKQRASLKKQADEIAMSCKFGVKQLDSGNRGIYMDETSA